MNLYLRALAAGALAVGALFFVWRGAGAADPKDVVIELPVAAGTPATEIIPLAAAPKTMLFAENSDAIVERATPMSAAELSPMATHTPRVQLPARSYHRSFWTYDVLIEYATSIAAEQDSLNRQGLVAPGTGLSAGAPLEYEGTFCQHFHAGMDIAAWGTPIHAPAAGTVVFAGTMGDGAMVVVIAHDSGLVSMYAHLDRRVLPVKAGDIVQAGDQIGSVGLTGITTGPHLHWGVWRDGELIDPFSIIGK